MSQIGENVAIGIGAVLWTVRPVALPLLLVPLVLSYFAYRAWVHGKRERDTMHHLYEAGRSLMHPLAGEDDHREFLGHLQQMMLATAAEIVVVEKGKVTLHYADGSLTLTADGGGDREVRDPEAFVRAHPGLTTSTAVTSDTDGIHAVLAIHREEALSSWERSLLEALASQFSVRLEDARLFAETMEQRRKLEEIIAHTSNGILVVDPDGSIVSWNHAMETMTGFSSKEAVGQPCAEILGIDWLLADEVAGSGAASLEGGAEGRDVQLVTKDRVDRWIRYTANGIVDHDGRTTASVVVARDVTGELEAEQLKADFVATVSHELRTPLTPLKGFLSALIQGTLDDSPDDRCEYYRIMMNQAERLERLITDLLEVSRMESMDPSIDSDVVELGGLVADQVDELGKSQQGRRIVFHGPGVPILVLADPFRLGQVVSNLVSNALKYSPPVCDIDVSVDRGEDSAVVSVRDQGDGIPLSEHERVFERFQRLENGLSRKTGGTGLGLYIAKRFVEAMSGRMWLVSAPGKGSTFSFSVPLAPPTRLGQAADGADQLAAAASAS